MFGLGVSGGGFAGSAETCLMDEDKLSAVLRVGGDDPAL